MVLTALAHHIDMEWMLSADARTRRDGVVGVDGQTANEYIARSCDEVPVALNAHVWICGGPGWVTVQVYPALGRWPLSTPRLGAARKAPTVEWYAGAASRR